MRTLGVRGRQETSFRKRVTPLANPVDRRPLGPMLRIACSRRCAGGGALLAGARRRLCDLPPLITKPSGLMYRDVPPAPPEDAKVAEPGSPVFVHYTGRLEDGTVFDTSETHGAPIEFVLGRREVIRGWEEGIAQMQVGGRRQLVIPPHLGYGARGAVRALVIKSGPLSSHAARHCHADSGLAPRGRATAACHPAQRAAAFRRRAGLRGCTGPPRSPHHITQGAAFHQVVRGWRRNASPTSASKCTTGIRGELFDVSSAAPATAAAR
jgi:hypothetical protein